MNEIIFRRINYSDQEDKKGIIELYKKVFNASFDEDYSFWYENNNKHKPLGVIAIYKETNQIIGHFSTVLFVANINGKKQNFRISMGFMTDYEYRGKGIATQLYNSLRKEIELEAETKFIMGFPNENSFKMHIEKMDYKWISNYKFVVLPNMNSNNEYSCVNCNDIITNCVFSSDVNHIDHTNEYLSWRFSNGKYLKFISNNKKRFIVTKFKNKVDILYWDQNVSEEELLDFAGFLYRKFKVDKVATWDSLHYLDKYLKEDREYHMCINFLDSTATEIEDIKKEWLFYMGDCELY